MFNIFNFNFKLIQNHHILIFRINQSLSYHKPCHIDDIIMKFILKGKQFLTKKLQELDLVTDNLDLVSQQIPNRLKQPLRVLQNTQIDLQSNDKFETYFKNYPNHHISHYLLQKYQMTLQANAIAPEYKLPADIEDVFIPNFDKQLQRKALLMKEVVDQYDEGYHKLDQSIICMAVIHFHHKRGTEVEFKYPQNKTVDQIEGLLLHHAMPDSSHNKMEDYNFFNFQVVIKGKKRMLFGVSYFKQIKVTEQMKAQNKQITRSYMQKALAVVSTLPLFGYLKLRLASTTKVFFADYTNYELISSAYKQLNKSLTESWPKLQMSQLYIGSDLKVIINLFGMQQFYEIWKAVLYQKRVVIFAHSSSSASSFIISLLTLFPGLSTFGVFSKPISKYMQSLRQYALPLRTFSSDNFMSMSFHIQDFHLLSKFQKTSKGSFLIGTTNRLLKEANQYGIEMLINLENCTIEKRKPRIPWEHLSKKQKTFIAEIQDVIKIQKSLGYEGSEDMIRNQFHSFLKSQLVDIMKANQCLLQWIADCKQYSQKSNKKQNKDKQKEKQTDNKIIKNVQSQQKAANNKKNQDFPPLIPDEVTSIPFPGLLLTTSFPYFLQFHNEKIPQIIQHKKTPSLLIQNYEYCLMLPNEQFIAYNWNDNKLSFGRGRKTSFQGKQIKFYSQNRQENKVKYIYLGQLQNHRFVKSGFYIDKNQHYEGEYDNGLREGYGKLINNSHRYIGNFKNNLYDGQGQLVKGKDIYVGEFKEGMRHGVGKNQGQLNYDGQWSSNKPQGSGLLKIGEIEYIGRFKKGSIDEQSEVTIRYQNGSMYKGLIKNLLPCGKGYLITENGTTFGQFANGQLVCSLNDSSRNEKQKISGQTVDKPVKKQDSGQNSIPKK